MLLKLINIMEKISLITTSEEIEEYHP